MYVFAIAEAAPYGVMMPSNVTGVYQDEDSAAQAALQRALEYWCDGWAIRPLGVPLVGYRATLDANTSRVIQIVKLARPVASLDGIMTGDFVHPDRRMWDRG